MGDDPEPAPRGLIGGYYLGALICETRNGYIFETLERGSRRKLAVKMIRKTQENSQTIEDECSILSEVKCRTVIALIAVIELDHFRCLVVPFAPAGDLLALIQLRAPMLEELAAKLLYLAFGALEHLHMQGIAHRDVRPENVLVTDADLADPDIALIDFGSARRFGEGDAFGDRVGSPHYWAPELFGDGDCTLPF
jgi:serine/threonine protein kinase